MSWSLEQVFALINTYQKHPCLYNVKHKLYINKHAGNNALYQIEREIDQIRPRTSKCELKVKFSGLNNTFPTEISILFIILSSNIAEYLQIQEINTSINKYM